MGKHTFEVTDATFQQEVLDSETPVLIDFWAEWCGPCKMIAPHVEDIAEEFAGQLRVGKFDVDSNPIAPETYGIQGIPTLLVFKGGEVAARLVGFRPKERLRTELATVLEKAKA
ncbi:MAG: thioredoxin [Anaerolineales bacterium]|nr:thioredoxin [Anaerolineales bacterium]